MNGVASNITNLPEGAIDMTKRRKASADLKDDAASKTELITIPEPAAPQVRAANGGFAIRSYVVPRISISAPVPNAVVSRNFTVRGTASCDLMQDRPGEPGLFIRRANEFITKVRVSLGSAAPVDATPTGPSATPWISWTFAVSGRPEGALTVTAEVLASGASSSGSARATRNVTVDVNPPTLAINRHGDVNSPPPYFKNITGTATDTASSVEAVEWRIGSNAFQRASGTTSWSAWVGLPGLGTHTVTFRARDTAGNVSGTRSTTIRVVDDTPPTVTISTPREGEKFAFRNDQIMIEVRGTATDSQTGVARVEWSLDNPSTFIQATPRAAGDWSTWSARVPITVAGNHRLFVRATDKATPANTRPLQVGFVVVEPFELQDPEAVFSPTAYLDDLLGFFTKRAKAATGGSPITQQQLVNTFLQPFIELVARDNRALANQSASQVRLCIEVLRRYLAKHGRSVPSQAESDYRLTVYQALLRQLGTSYDEIRLARVAGDSVRAALANRLGIAASPLRPDRLDELLLQPSGLTEVSLRNLFGLEETTVKPLADSFLPQPNLLIWQKDNLRTVWQGQDDAARSELDTPVPVIDPDLVGTKDLRSPETGNSAYDLWKSRRDNLAAQLIALDTTRKAQATQQAGFDRIISDTLGPVAQLLALLEQRRNGNSIDSQMRARLLTMPAFLHLMRVRELAVANAVLDEEWDDVYAILIQVKKLGLHAAWRAEEQQKGLILGPDHFQLADDPQSQIEALPRWRATPQARQAWRRTLESRLQQEQTLTQAMQSVVSAAEQAALPILRNACITAIAGNRDVSVTADRLTQELGIDCKDSGHLRTTRAQQALATLQEVLLSLRTGRFKNAPPVLGTTNPAANWVLAIAEADFDEDWRWMGGYTTWHAAMRVFAYPESYLQPELRPTSSTTTPTIVQTAAFGQLMKELFNQPRLTAEEARRLAEKYHLQLTAELAATPEPADNLPASLRRPGFAITEQLTDSQLATRRQTIRTLFGNVTNPFLAATYLQEIFFFVPVALALALQKSGQYLAALDWIETFYTDHFAPADRKIYHGLKLEETLPTQYEINPDTWLREELNPHVIAMKRANSYTRFTLMTLVRCYLDFADAEFTRDDVESVARARSLYVTALDLLALPEMQPPAGSAASPFPPNPVPQALKMRAELNLFKLRSGRNIAGIERQLTPLTEPALMLDRLPAPSDAQRLFRPTPYRYAVLVERAKNLVSIAQQVEQAFLAALEKRDAEAYNLLKAGHDLQLASATVNLQALRVKEAQQGVGLAELQLDRAAIQRDTYQEWIDAGLNRWEEGMLQDYKDARNHRNTIAGLDAALTFAQALTTSSSGGFLGTGIGGGLGAAIGVGALAAVRAGFAIQLNNAETSAQINSAKASFERRQQDWEFQLQLSESDMAIGQQQVAIAQTHTAVVRQEELISRTQQEQAQDTVDFLAQKFTSAELYAWMSGVLGGAYSYFLQQATAVAQLAQHQLGFERQETPPAFIKADYWDTTGETASPSSNRGDQPDRQGLTGSVRLLQDITRLDQFAFETNRRKLQLAETFSLARLFPLEFQQFRESGRLPFATPMSLFDRGFPGHYLRLIKRVRISIIALVPPVQGVRATLINSGISRVVSGGDVFQSILVRRDPELIAFTSPSNATGLIELEPETGMLLPFESMGVDTNWELQLPKAANPFDYRSIADVLFTVEYTALQDFSYRQQVIQQLEETVSAERVFSLRDHFADQWYALHNPEQAETPMTVTFSLASQNFPPNVAELRIQHVLLAVARAEGLTFEIGSVQLILTPQGETVPVGGEVNGATDGLISTRRGNASAWVPLIGRSPVGAWELTLPDTEEMRNRFENEEIDDLLLVLTYEGRTSAWPD
jgi:Tc toxin complex TcA C-terminal TcB-binding domain/Bacterial Ig domain